MYIVAAFLLGLAITLAQTVIWTIYSPASVGLTVTVIAQAGAAVVFFSTCLLGRQPRIDVVLEESTLEVSSAGGAFRIPLDSVTRVQRIDAQLYHRHYRRYERVLTFVNRIPDQLLLIETVERPVVLGLSESGLQRLERVLAGVSDRHPVV